MTSLESRTEQFGPTPRRRMALMSRLRVRVRAPQLDSDLAAGICPSASAAHLARADRITHPRIRRRIRAALNRALEDAHAPQRRLTAEAPLSRAAVRACRKELRRLAEAVVTTENPRVQGVAIAHQLAFDGTGALYFQPGENRSVERLANTIRAARSALSVSGDFDRPSGRWPETLA
jgi:hypothetical protein